MTEATERKPHPPFPGQDLDPPGEEAKMAPRPRYQAPEYRGSGKLEGKVALIADSSYISGEVLAVLGGGTTAG